MGTFVVKGEVVSFFGKTAFMETAKERNRRKFFANIILFWKSLLFLI